MKKHDDTHGHYLAGDGTMTKNHLRIVSIYSFNVYSYLHLKLYQE